MSKSIIDEWPFDRFPDKGSTWDVVKEKVRILQSAFYDRVRIIELQLEDKKKLQIQLSEAEMRAYAAICLVPDNTLCGELRKIKNILFIVPND